MEQLLLNNKFIFSFTELYKSVVSEVKSVSEFEYKSSKSFPFRKQKVEIKKYPQIEINLDILKSLKEEKLNPNGMSFYDLWEFCQFVKFAEKSFFYYNDPSKLFYVDSNIDDYNKRKFVIKDENETYQLLFSLEIEKNPNEGFVLEPLKIIRLSIIRNYGRKMSNEFIIVNSEVKYNDDADIYLIDNINRIIYERISFVFDEIKDSILVRSNYNE